MGQIEIKNAQTHNLKGIDVKIPHNKLVVISGLSGSGKSSLALDTLYAEGQRRYIESLSSYIRQFLDTMHKPKVDYIKDLPPAIAIEQKVISNNPRSTVGTSTEIYEYMKMLFAKIGKTVSPVSNTIVQQDTVVSIVDFITGLPKLTEVYIASPICFGKEQTVNDKLQSLQQQGFSRILINYKAIRISDFQSDNKSVKKDDILLLIDRIKNDGEKATESRLFDSIETAFYEGNNRCSIVYFINNKQYTKDFSQYFEKDGIVFEKPTADLFSFNNPIGACPVCEGLGVSKGISEDLVIPNKNLSIYDDAIHCWRGEMGKMWKNELILNAEKFDFPIHKPYCELSEEQKQLLWEGNKYFEGINTFFKFVESQKYKVQYRVLQSRYRGTTICPACKGTRLRKEASYVKLFFRN